MLFISILLSIWFVAWLINSAIIRNVKEFFVEQLYPDEIEEEKNELIAKSEDNGIYHLSCNNCNYDWWSIESNVNYCPNCGKKIGS